MALLLIDLDNTLVDRDAAFRESASCFLAEQALPARDLDWLMTVDASGYRPRADVARAVTARYGSGVPEADVRAFLDRGAAERVTLAEPTRQALVEAAEAGWDCVIVTNGRVAQQERKIRRTGLDALVRAWVISEAVGRKKPDPAIFETAARTVGASPRGSWVVGDSPHADVRGALGIGAWSVWVSGGRTWPEDTYHPTHTTHDTAAGIRHALRVGSS